MPPSLERLEERLRGRKRDPEAAILRRLQTARGEIKAYPEYDYVVVNDEVGPCADRVRAVILAERCRLGRMASVAESIAVTFRS
jgi:guanylate kinase